MRYRTKRTGRSTAHSGVTGTVVRDNDKEKGERVIYYFHDDAMPLYLLTLFAKGDRANLSKAERNELAEIAECFE